MTTAALQLELRVLQRVAAESVSEPFEDMLQRIRIEDELERRRVAFGALVAEVLR